MESMDYTWFEVLEAADISLRSGGQPVELSQLVELEQNNASSTCV